MIHQITIDFLAILNYIIPVMAFGFSLRTAHHCYLAHEHTKELYMIAVYSVLYTQLHYLYMSSGSDIRLPIDFEMGWRMFHIFVFIYFLWRIKALGRAASKKFRTFIKTPIDSHS